MVRNLEYTFLKVDGRDIRIGKKGQRVVTIDLALNDAENYAVVKNFSNNNMSWKTASYTRIFQNQLAGFTKKCLDHPQLRDKGVGKLADDLRNISEIYADLEALINNVPQGMTVDPISELLSTLTDVENKLNLYPALNEAENAAIKQQLLAGIAAFKMAAEQLQTRVNPPATKTDIRRLFCMQPEDPNIPSLGKLVGAQMLALSKFGMNRTYELTDQTPDHKIANRFEQAFIMHELTKHLSDAAAFIEIKGFALYGARYNNMRQPVPKSMLQNIRPQREGLSEELQWTNIRPYISSTDNIAMVQQVVNFVNKQAKIREASNSTHNAEIDQTHGLKHKSRTSKFVAGLTTAGVILGTLIAIPLVTIYAGIKVFAYNKKPNNNQSAPKKPKFYEKIKNTRIMANIRAYRIFIENIKELALFVPIRAGLSITAGLVHFGLMPVVGTLALLREAVWEVPKALSKRQAYNAYSNAARGRISGAFAWLQKDFDAFDKFCSYTHQTFSPVIAAKKQHNKYLKNINPEFRQKLNNPVSYYDVGLTFISSAKVTDLVFNGVRTFGNGIYGLRDTISDLATSKKGRKKVADRYIDEMEIDINLIKALKDGLQDSAAPQGENVAVADAAKDAVVIDAKRIPEVSVTTEPDSKKFRVRAEEQEWAMNHMSSPLDFFDDVAYGLAQFVIDPMFRKSPAAATMFFAFANLSFGAMMAPAVFGAGASHALTIFPKILTKMMMGKEVGEHASFLNNMIAAFVEWKVPFFTFEAMIELNHNPDFLDELLNNSEQITTMVTIGVALGWAMHFLPPIPNDINIMHGHAAEFEKVPGAKAYAKFANTSIHYYLAAVNVFINESKEVTQHGFPPLTGVEYAFLAVKATLVFENLVTGGHKAYNPKIRDFLIPNKDDPYETLQKITTTMKQLISKHSDLNGKPLSEIVALKGELWVKQNLILPAIKVQNGYHNGVDKYKNEVVDYLFDSMQAGFVEAKVFNDKAQEAKQEFVLNAEKTQAQAELNAEADRTLEAAAQQANVDPDFKDMHEKRKRMLQLIQMVRKMDLHGKKFKTTAEANDVYNELYYSIKNYNNAQRKLGNWDQQFDKEQFLHSFYNKHVYKGSNNFVRLGSFIPFAPITLAWRALQYTFGSPALKYKVKKSFAKDYSIAMQFFSFMARPGVIATRSYSYLLLAVVALAVPYALTRLISWPQQFWRFLTGYKHKPENDPSQNPTVGDQIFGYCIDLARKPEPYAHWTKFTAAVIATPFVVFPGVVEFFVKKFRKSSQAYTYQRVYNWFAADRGAAKYAEKIRIADTNETLRDDVNAALDQLNASKAYDAAKIKAETAEPTAQQNIDVLSEQEQTKLALESSYANVRNRTVHHGKTHLNLFRKIRHANKRRAEKATLVAYTKELRILENRVNILFNNLNNNDPAFKALRGQFTALIQPILMQLHENTTNVNEMAVKRSAIQACIKQLEKLQAAYDALVKLNAGEKDESKCKDNTNDDLGSVSILSINNAILDILVEYELAIIDDPEQADVVVNNRRKYEKGMLEVALKLESKAEQLKYLAYLVNSLEAYQGTTELSKNIAATLSNKITAVCVAKNIKSELDLVLDKNKPGVVNSMVSSPIVNNKALQQQTNEARGLVINSSVAGPKQNKRTCRLF